MKNIGILFATGLLLVGMSSCIKGYNCTCNTTNEDGTVTSDVTAMPGLKKTSEAACEALESESTTDGITIKTECSI